MIGRLISKIRTDKNVTKTELAKMTGINIGHLTHIEKEERNPSHKALKSISDALDVPIQTLMYAYDRNLTEEQLDYMIIDHVNYNCVPIVNSIIGYSPCPSKIGKTSFIMRSFDNSMSPKISSTDYVYIELNAPLNNKDIGLFNYNNRLLIRKFIVRKNDIVLRAEDNKIDDIVLKKDSKFFILGKIIAKNNNKMNQLVTF